MKSNWNCKCGRCYEIESETPFVISETERKTVIIGGKEYPAKNDKGEALVRVEGDKAFYEPIPASQGN